MSGDDETVVLCRHCNEPLPKDYLYPVCEKCLKEGTIEESTLPPVEPQGS